MVRSAERAEPGVYPGSAFHFADSHAHLADPAFDSDLEQVLERAVRAGAVAVICIGESVAAAQRARTVAASHPELLSFTAGVHPHDAAGFDPVADPEQLVKLIATGAVAVGECGLDYHYDHAPRDLQRRAFAAQLSLALDAALPVVVHTRDAEDDTRAMVVEAGAAGVRGVLHCFTGSTALAEAALAVGWYVSFSGIITFRAWTDTDLLRMIPAGRLLVESDSPYLAPVPMRGKRNEPAWVSHTLARLADVRDEPVRDLSAAVVRNTAALFRLTLPEGIDDGSFR